MKRTIAIAMLSLFLFLTFGCASTYYEVRTNDGKDIITREKPDYDDDNKTYQFTDIEGHKWKLNRDAITSIEMKKRED